MSGQSLDPPGLREQHLVATFQHYLTKEYFISMWKDHPDRFFWFADSIDPRVEGYTERAAQDLDRGATSLKLLPLFVDTEMGDVRWRPIFELLRERRKPCIIDLSWWYADREWFCPSVYGKYSSYTEYVKGLSELVGDFAELRVQIAHYGTARLRDPGDKGRPLRYARLHEPIDLVRKHHNLSFDLAAYQHQIKEEEPFPYERALRVLEVMVEGVGAKRIQWGTDWPYLGRQPYAELIRAIREAPFLPDDQSDDILGLNALRFVGQGKR